MQAFCLLGMCFGDEGKGAATDSLARQFPGEDVLIVRYNGACQAAHNVITPEGKHHCFSQFGAGMLANKNVRTHLSRFMLVEPFSMINESRALNVLTPFIWGRTTVDARAPIITPFCKYLNQLRERSRGKNRHGSCGRGVGVTRELQIRFNDDERVLRAGDLRDEKLTFEKLNIQLKEIFNEMQDLEKQVGEDPSSEREHRRAMLEWVTRYSVWPASIVDEMPKSAVAIFEGAQGVMLDETHGTAPHNTWTNTTFENADTCCSMKLEYTAATASAASVRTTRVMGPVRFRPKMRR
jgi:adenylosuccinate synthase